MHQEMCRDTPAPELLPASPRRAWVAFLASRSSSSELDVGEMLRMPTQPRPRGVVLPVCSTGRSSVPIRLGGVVPIRTDVRVVVASAPCVHLGSSSEGRRGDVGFGV